MQLLHLQPSPSNAVHVRRLTRHDYDPVYAIVARDYSYGGVPNGLTRETEDDTFIGYLTPGIDLEMFRGAILDHYERESKQAA